MRRTDSQVAGIGQNARKICAAMRWIKFPVLVPIASALLHHFGSARAVGRAALADLEKVDGISAKMAKIIYDHFHGEGQ